jgi:hypothetical protein
VRKVERQIEGIFDNEHIVRISCHDCIVEVVTAHHHQGVNRDYYLPHLLGRVPNHPSIDAFVELDLRRGGLENK